MEDTFTRQLLLGDSSAFEMAYQWYLEAYKAGMTFPQYFGLHRPHLNLPQYHEMFENYDVQLKDPNISTAAVPYIFKLKYANPEELAELLNRILQRRWEGIKDKPAQVIRFMPDPGRKRLIVLASPDDMQLIEALIAELDIIAKHKTVVLKAAPYAKPRQDTPAENTFTQIIKLQYTDCESLAEKLTTLFAGEPLRIVPHEHTNTLLVAGTESAIKKIKDVVAAIDVPSSKKELEIQY